MPFNPGSVAIGQSGIPLAQPQQFDWSKLQKGMKGGAGKGGAPTTAAQGQGAGAGAYQASSLAGNGGMGQGSAPLGVPYAPPGGAAALSDRHSKKRISELEDELSNHYAALGGDKAELTDLAEKYKGAQYATTASYPTPQAPDTAALDEAYRRPQSYSYEYKDPGAAGAAPGEHAGPMADELAGIPGVVQQGPDGMQRVDTGRLALSNTSQVAKQRRELDALHERLTALEGDPDAQLRAAAGGR